MFKGNLHLSIVLLLTAITFSPAGTAQNCDLANSQDIDYWTMLGEFNGAGCFDFDNNQSTLAQTIRKYLNDNSEKNFQRALRSLSSIQSYLKTQYIEPQNTGVNNASALNNAISSLKQDIIEHPDEPIRDYKDLWKIEMLGQLPDRLDQINLKDSLASDRCTEVKNPQCDKEFNAASDIVRALHLLNAAVDKYSEKYRAESYAHRILRRAKWDSYYDDLTFQYPWELLANNALLKDYESPVDEDGNKKGFRELPNKKLVVLHPEANLVYADNAQDEYEITITVEAIGYESFDFDINGKVKNAMGVSLLAAYMDQANQAKSGWTAGLLFKYEGYSLGVTDNHGDPGIVFNINLSQKIFDVKQDSRKYYDRYHKNIQYMGELVNEGKQKLGDFKKIYQISE